MMEEFETKVKFNVYLKATKLIFHLRLNCFVLEVRFVFLVDHNVCTKNLPAKAVSFTKSATG